MDGEARQREGPRDSFVKWMMGLDQDRDLGPTSVQMDGERVGSGRVSEDIVRESDSDDGPVLRNLGIDALSAVIHVLVMGMEVEILTSS